MYRRRPRRRGLPVNAEINLTNLIDVAFVLLIIFIITAPILQGGIEVDLPEASATPLAVADPIMIALAADNQLFLGTQVVGSIDEMEALLGVMLSADPGRAVAIKGDRVAHYGAFMDIVDLLNRLEKHEISFVTSPRLERE